MHFFNNNILFIYHILNVLEKEKKKIIMNIGFSPFCWQAKDKIKFMHKKCKKREIYNK